MAIHSQKSVKNRYNRICKEHKTTPDKEEKEDMKNFLKGTAIMVIILVVLIAVNVACNLNGIDLDAPATGTVSAVSAMLIYEGLTKKRKSN